MASQSREALSGFSDDELASEASKHDDLPHGSERDIIEYYFYRGLTYRHITLMLEKQHNIIMNQRTLKRRVKDYGLKRREKVDEELKEKVKDLILLEICTGSDMYQGCNTSPHSNAGKG